MPELIELQQRIQAPRHRIWEACASAAGLANWQADIAQGDARAGGKFTLEWPAFGARVELEIVEWVPFEKLTLRNAETLVRLTVMDGSVLLSHQGLELGEDADGLMSSWRIALGQLAHSVERHPGRSRRVRWSVRSIVTSPQMAYLFFSEPTCLGLWLTGSAVVGQEGEAFRLVLRDGTLLEGSVLTRVEGRDLALAVHSHQDSVLTLRTLPSPGDSQRRLVALVWSDWGPPTAQAAGVIQSLATALSSLEQAMTKGGAA